MKRITAMLLAAMCLCSCAPEGNNDDAGITVYTSFYGMYDLTKMIAGEAAEVKLLMPPGIEAHDWEPGTTDMLELGSADIFVYSGDDMEPWAQRVSENVGNASLKIVVASEGIEPLSQNGAHTDPHVWLNPQNAIVQLKNITDAMCEKDGQNAEYYLENFEKAKEELGELDEEYKAAAAGFSDKEIIVTHGAFAYLCEAYGLEQRMLEGLSGESDPSAAAMSELIDYMKKQGKRAIFYVKAEGAGAAESIAAETGAEMYPLDPFENGDGERGYCEVMRENLETLQRALGSNE